MTQVKGRRRVVFLDFLRAIACLMVIITHCGECFYIADGPILNFALDDRSFSFVAFSISLVRSCVPLFVMASSYLMMPVEGSTRQFFTRRGGRVVIPFIIWSLIYTFSPCFVDGAPVDSVWSNLTHLIYNFNDHAGHLWFIYMLLGVYLIMPVISPWLKTVSRRGEEAFLAVWFVSTFMAYAHYFLGYIIGEGIWNEFHALYYYSGFIGYVVLAHYIRTYLDWSAAKSWAIGGTCYIVGFIPTFFIFNSFKSMSPADVDWSLVEMPWKFCTPNVALMAFGLFMIFKTIKRAPEWLLKPVESLSKMSYGMYLMHIIVLGIYAKYFVGTMPVELAIPMMAIAVYATTWCVSRILSVIPGGRYLVG